MSVTDGLRGAGLYTPSWTQSCNGNPSINEILDQIDAGAIENANDTVKDFHIDWGVGPDQINTDDIPEGVNNFFYDDALVEAFLGFGNDGDFLITNPTEDGYLWASTLAGSRISLDTTNFDKNLSPADNTVQKALETIDNLDVGGVSFQVTQNAHGFSNLSSVYHNGTNWQLAQANNQATLGTHVITEIIDINNFVVSQVGRIIVNAHGLNVGKWYFTSDSTAGLLTTVESHLFSNPMLYVLDSNNLILAGYRASAGNYMGIELHNTRVYPISTQSIPNGSETKLTNLGIDYDTNNCWDNTNQRVLIKRAGYYLLTGQVVMGASSANTLAWRLRLNGSTTILNYQSINNNISTSLHPGSTVRYLQQGDYVEMLIGQNSGGSFSLTGGNQNNCFFGVTELPQSVLLAVNNAMNVNKFKFRATKTTTQAISNVTNTKVQWDNIVYNPNNNWDAGNYRYLIPVSGYYSISSAIRIDTSTASIVQLIIAINGATISRVTNTGNSPGGVSHSDILKLNQGDYVEIHVYQNSGSSQNIVNDGTTNVFAIHFLSIDP